MSKVHSSETETLDEKIKRIRKKNEEIEKRRLEVEADIQTAAKLNAVVQLNAPKEDWPLPRAHSPDEERGRTVAGNHQEKPRERCRGNVTFGDTVNEANRPPPDPAYRFLADAERDPIPTKNPERSQRHSRGRGHGLARGRGRDHKGRSDGPSSGRGTPVYEAWRAERNRIDEERISRQRTAQGQWRREWDSQKSEEDWEALRSERAREQNSTLNRTSRTNAQHELALADKGDIINSGKNVSRNPTTLPSHSGLVLKSIVQANENRNVQSTGNVLHVSFANEPTVKKASTVSTSRRPATGSGRTGLPPPRPQQRRAASGAAGPSTEALPQRRPREGRARRRPAGVRGSSWGRREAAAARKSGRKSSGDGDESWEDADDHSDQEGHPPQDSHAQPSLPPADAEAKASKHSERKEGKEVGGELAGYEIREQEESPSTVYTLETRGNLDDTSTPDVKGLPTQEYLDGGEGCKAPPHSIKDEFPDSNESETSGVIEHEEDHAEGNSDACCVTQDSKILSTDEDLYDTVTVGNENINTLSSQDNFSKENGEENIEELVGNEKAAEVLVSTPASNAIDSAAIGYRHDMENSSASCVAIENVIKATNCDEIGKETKVSLLQPEEIAYNVSKLDTATYISEEALCGSNLSQSTIQIADTITVNTSDENTENSDVSRLDESTKVLQCDNDPIITGIQGADIESPYEDYTPKTSNEAVSSSPMNKTSSDVDCFFETSNEKDLKSMRAD